ncbi:MAG: ABC transporter permease [Clostridiales bacterium]|nr:ABC transporter permease [Clostridiales bacterium]
MRALIRKSKRELLLIAVIAMLFVVFHLISGSFLSYVTLANVLSGYAIYGIMAIGMMLIISTGNIDVSVGAQLAVVSMSVSALVDGGVIDSVPAAVLFSAAIGAALGLANGLLVSALKLPAIIVTLGTMNIMRGILLLVAGSSWNTGLPMWFKSIARTVPFDLRLKMTVYIWLILCAAAYFHMYRTVSGRKILSVGANPEGARRIGYSPGASYVLTFVITGVTCGIGGLLYSSNVGMAQPIAGLGYEMTLIAAVVIGGTSFTGGKISILGTFLGVVLLSVIERGMVISKIPVYWQELVKGAVIIIAISLSALSAVAPGKGRGRRVSGEVSRG